MPGWRSCNTSGGTPAKSWLSEHVPLRLAETASPADAEATQRRHRYLASCFAALSKPDRRLIEKCYAADRDGHTNKLSDIANQAGMRVASLYNALSRIRRRLFHCMQTKLSQESRQ